MQLQGLAALLAGHRVGGVVVGLGVLRRSKSGRGKGLRLPAGLKTRNASSEWSGRSQHSPTTRRVEPCGLPPRIAPTATPRSTGPPDQERGRQWRGGCLACCADCCWCPARTCTCPGTLHHNSNPLPRGFGPCAFGCLPCPWHLHLRRQEQPCTARWRHAARKEVCVTSPCLHTCRPWIRAVPSATSVHMQVLKWWRQSLNSSPTSPSAVAAAPHARIPHDNPNPQPPASRHPRYLYPASPATQRAPTASAHKKVAPEPPSAMTCMPGRRGRKYA